MAHDKYEYRFEQPKFVPQEGVHFQQYDPSEVPLTEDLLPVESPDHTCLPASIVNRIREALDVFGDGRKLRVEGVHKIRVEDATLAAKRKRVAARLEERNIYLSRYFR